MKIHTFHVPIIIGAAILTACGSRSSSNAQPGSELSQPSEPETGQANEQVVEPVVEPGQFSLEFVEERSDQTNIVSYLLRLVLEGEPAQSHQRDEIVVNLTGAVWESENLPSSCTVIYNNSESIDMLNGSVSCLVTEDTFSSDQNIAGFNLPVAHPPYKQQDINATASFSASPSIVAESLVIHYPDGETNLEPSSPVSTEILRFLDIASGSISNGLIGIAKSTLECAGGGEVEEVPFGGGRFPSKVNSSDSSVHFFAFSSAGQDLLCFGRYYYNIVIYSNSGVDNPMAKTTSFNLGDHFDQFISNQIDSGRFGNASEVVRASLRLLENEEHKLEALRQALIDGENSGTAGELDREKIRRKAKKKAGLSR